MSTKYYFTSNGSLREIRDDELMHLAPSKGVPRDNHKYISREWKNGKWVYTYNKPGSKVTRTTTNVKDTNKLFSSTSTTVFNDTHKTVTYNRGVLERVGNNIASKLGIKDYFDKREQDWYESKDRATEKAAKKASEDGAKLKDTDELHDSKTIITVGDNKIVTYDRGKIEQYVSTAKEYIRDRLGFDEKEKYEEASKAAKTARGKTDRERLNYKDTRKREEDPGDTLYTTKRRNETSKFKQGSENAVDERLYAEIAEKKAREDYSNTLLGKLENARDVGEKWLEKLFGNKW